MEIYQSEEQQVEAIKSYWKENGNSLIAGLVIGLGAFVGWNVYQDNKVEAQEHVSAEFEKAMVAFETQQTNFKENTEKFIAANDNNAYSVFAAFALAKSAVAAQDWAAAEQHLSKAVTLSTDENLQSIAILRLARVQLQQQEFDKVLASLEKPMPESFKASIEVIKGDTFILQGKHDLAKVAYQAAADAGGLQSSPALQMKLDDLATTSVVK